MFSTDATAYGFTLTDPFATTPALSSSLDNLGGSNSSLPSGVSGSDSAALVPSTGNSFLDGVARLTALGATAVSSDLSAYTSFLNARTASTLAAKGVVVPSNTSVPTVPLNDIPATTAANSSKFIEYVLVAAAVFFFYEVMKRK